MAAPANKPKPFIAPVFIPHAELSPTGVCSATRRPQPGWTIRICPPDISARPFPTSCRFRQDDRRTTEISYYGGNFLGLDADRIVNLLALAADYVYSGRADGIRFSTRPDTIDEERLALIAPFPVTTIELGVQSMSDRVLGMSGRGHTAAQTRRAVDMIRRKDTWRLGLQLMPGLPGDTGESVMKTGRACAAMEPDFVRIYPTLVLKGSLLARWYADGRYAPLSLEAAVEQARDLFRMFLRNDIAVIRMGLQPTEDLSPETGVVAGPYHPAFGELVHAALWLERLGEHLNAHPPAGGNLSVQAHPTDISKVQGQKCGNIEQLITLFKLGQIEITTDDSIPPQTVLVNGTPCRLRD